jgi:uncharacterized protein (TIGR02996 family)
MPPRKKKPEPTQPAPKAAAKKNPGKPAARKTSPADPTPVAGMPALIFQPTAGQALLAAIKKYPDDLTTHLVYADWLAEHNQETRAAALRAWAELVRIPFRADTAPRVLAALRAYWESLLEEDARWLEAMERVRPWIPRPLAEKIVRVCLDDVYGPAAAEAWAVEVTRCFFDDRWHGAYKGQTENGKTTARSGAFFVNQLTGRLSGHVMCA